MFKRSLYVLKFLLQFVDINSYPNRNMTLYSISSHSMRSPYPELEVGDGVDIADLDEQLLSLKV